MSVVANIIGSLAKAKFYAFSNTTKQTVHTVETRIETLASAFFSNDTGSGVQCKLYHYDVGTTAERLVWTKLVAANSTEEVASAAIRLRENDQIRAIGAASVTLKLDILTQLENARQ